MFRRKYYGIVALRQHERIEIFDFVIRSFFISTLNILQSMNVQITEDK
jgi:hypothetical protein